MVAPLMSGMLVVVDSDADPRSLLAMARRFGASVALMSRDASSAEGMESQRSAMAEPTIDEAFRAASMRNLPWVGIRRDFADPESLLREILVAVGRHRSAELPGFGVLLTAGEPAPFRRILAIIDRGSGPTSGLLAYAAVGVATASGAVLDFLVIASHGEDVSSDEEIEALAISRERELYEAAIELSVQESVETNWVTAGAVADKWLVITDQLSQHDYDLVIDDLGDVTLGGRVRRGGNLDAVLAEGKVGAIPLRLLREVDIPLLLVVDEIRLGMAPAALLRAGTAAAVATGILGTALISTRASTVAAMPVTEAAQESNQVVAELEDALGTSTQDRKAAASASSRGAARQTTTQAAAEAETKAKAAPTAPKGGATVSQVNRAESALEESKEEHRDAKAALEKAEKELAQAKEDLAAAEKAGTASLAELQQTRDAVAVASTKADALREDATGLSGLIPGGATDEEAAAAAAAAAAADQLLDQSVEAGAEALDDISAAEEDLDRAQAAVEKAEAEKAEAKADYSHDRAKYEAYKKSLAATRQSPVNKGSYRLTARFGQAGGYWSSGYHTGLDLAGAVGTDIKAAASGTVVEAGYAGAYGNRVVIDHGNGYTTTYNHMSAIRTSAGDKVQTGDHIGELGSTGNSTGPHCHFEVTKNGKFIDPEAWLGW
ncbi:MAG: peptidoglycan DD-metalloendopeptidase family protein [Propionicimonas sp.]